MALCTVQLSCSFIRFVCVFAIPLYCVMLTVCKSVLSASFMAVVICSTFLYHSFGSVRVSACFLENLENPGFERRPLKRLEIATERLKMLEFPERIRSKPNHIFWSIKISS